MKRILISCVTFETVKVSNPVKTYNPDKVYLIHYSINENPDNVYYAFYVQTKKLINEISDKIEIVERNEKVYDFAVMLKTVLEIMKDEKDNEIYVNVSAGSPAFTAAATIASMMYKNTIPFIVNAGKNGYTVNGEKIKEVYFSKDGKTPIGMMSSTSEPMLMPKFNIEPYEEYLVKGLKIFKENQNEKSSKIIEIMKEDKEIWGDISHRKGTSEDAKKRVDSVYYRRYFLDKWEKHGWVKEEKNGFRTRYVVTKDGEDAIETFCFDKKIENENLDPGQKDS